MYHNLVIVSGVSTVIFFIIWNSWQQVKCQGQSHTQIHFSNAGNCDMKGLNFLINYFYVQHYYSKNYLNVSFDATDDIKELKTAYMHIERCNQQGYYCEDFQNWRIDHLCQMLKWKNQLWSEFVYNMHPHLRCPIKKATYLLHNFTLNLDILLKWYPEMEKYRWKFSYNMTNGYNNIVSCVSFETRLEKFTKQNRKPSRRS